MVLGDNGSGKSSFLRAIALALVGAGRAEGLRQSWNDWLTHGEQEGEIRLMLRSATPDVDHAANLPADNLYSPGVKLRRQSGGEVDIDDLPSNDPPRARFAPSMGVFALSAPPEWFSTSFGPFRRFSGGTNQFSELPPLLARHLSLFDEGVAFTTCLDWLQDLKFRALEHDPEGGLLDRLIGFVNESGCLPSGVRIEDVTSRNVMFRDANGGVVPVMDLSDGYRSVLSMTFEIVRQMAMTFGPDEVFAPDDPAKVVPEGVVIVDEIDTHLHPTWQSRIGHWFCDHFPNVQFIVSTHSPLLCQSAENGSVYLLPRSGSGEKGGKLKRDTLLRLVHGTVLDAYGTEAFASEAAATAIADEVEHFRPKDLYPEVVFAWMNYLYACGPCNGWKSNKFVVIDDTGAFVDVTRPYKAPVVRPDSGDAALIDPRRENPLDFLMLDLRETFEFTPIADAGTQYYERASYTIEVLGLNDRDYLVMARKTAFEIYRALLCTYGRERDPQRRYVGMRAIRDNNHPTVWWEMKRQRQRWEELANLFAHAPEFLDL